MYAFSNAPYPHIAHLIDVDGGGDPLHAVDLREVEVVDNVRHKPLGKVDERQLCNLLPLQHVERQLRSGVQLEVPTSTR